jgi:hypothetical protein
MGTFEAAVRLPYNEAETAVRESDGRRPPRLGWAYKSVLKLYGHDTDIERSEIIREAVRR